MTRAIRNAAFVTLCMVATLYIQTEPVKADWGICFGGSCGNNAGQAEANCNSSSCDAICQDTDCDGGFDISTGPVDDCSAASYVGTVEGEPLYCSSGACWCSRIYLND